MIKLSLCSQVLLLCYEHSRSDTRRMIHTLPTDIAHFHSVLSRRCWKQKALYRLYPSRCRVVSAHHHLK
jgi:hypothetical protein